MFKRSLSVLMAVLLVAAVSVISVSALVPGTYAPPNDADGKIFFNLSYDENDDPVYTWAGASLPPAYANRPQHSVLSAEYEDGYVTIVFTQGPELSSDGNYYWGSIAAAINGVSIAVDTDSVNHLQTITYEQAAEDDYVPITFTITLTPVDEGTETTHDPYTYYVNVDPEDE
jgi:hypothetical protein